jgi:hypothetical protein
MCFTGVILNPYRRPIHDGVVGRLLEEMEWNPEGFYVYSLDPRVYIRTLDYEMFRPTLSQVLGSNPPAIHFHFRLATVGKVAVYNAHGWDIGGHLVTHNGIVGAYSYEDESGYSDTLRLVAQKKFRELLLGKRWKNLYEYLSEKDFKGVMFIVSRDFNEVYAISRGRSIRYYRLNNVTYATSKELLTGSTLRKARVEAYANGVFQVTYDRVLRVV